MPNPKELKDFIFDELIKEVLNSIIPKEETLERYGYSNGINIIKEKAKELYNINL